LTAETAYGMYITPPAILNQSNTHTNKRIREELIKNQFDTNLGVGKQPWINFCGL